MCSQNTTKHNKTQQNTTKYNKTQQNTMSEPVRETFLKRRKRQFDGEYLVIYDNQDMYHYEDFEEPKIRFRQSKKYDKYNNPIPPMKSWSLVGIIHP